MARKDKNFRFPIYDDRNGVKLSGNVDNNNRPIANYDIFSEDEVNNISKEYGESQIGKRDIKEVRAKKKLRIDEKTEPKGYNKPEQIPVPKFDRYRVNSEPIDRNKKPKQEGLFHSDYTPSALKEQSKIVEERLRERLEKSETDYTMFAESEQEPERTELKTETTSEFVKQASSIKANEYRSFANEPREEDIEHPEEKIIPKAKRKIQASKASQLESIPFKRKKRD